MSAVLDPLYAAALVVALWTNGLAVGLGHGRRGLLAPLRRTRLVLTIGVVDVVAVPLVVYGLVRAVGISGDFAVGLVLVGVAAAGPLGIAVTQLARGDTALAAALVVSLELVNLLAIPLWALVLLPSGTEVPVLRIVGALGVLVVLPIAVGCLWRHRSAAAERFTRPFRIASIAALVTVLTVVLLRDGDALGETFAERVPLVAVLAVLAALALGWFAGGAVRTTRAATSVVTGVRASGPALAVAEASFPDRPGVRLAIVVFALVALTASVAVALVLRRVHTEAPLAGTAEAR